ncbi:hypothetical protein VTN00DRAFT_8860 [Thermoascus crustaceus]|uniref:uncharacterized protein n=1 Tax=Thermoascus crustaceus TaxID=5088 RepID=UPI003744A104
MLSPLDGSPRATTGDPVCIRSSGQAGGAVMGTPRMTEREPRYRRQMLSAGWKAPFAASGCIHVTGPASPDRPIQSILIVTLQVPCSHHLHLHLNVISCTVTSSMLHGRRPSPEDTNRDNLAAPRHEKYG